MSTEPQNPGTIQAIPRNPNGTFPKGVSGHPGKTPGTKHLTTKVREALEKISEDKGETYEVLLVKKVLHKAIVEGDGKMITLIWNYLDGTPRQSLDISGAVASIGLDEKKYKDLITREYDRLSG